MKFLFFSLSLVFTGKLVSGEWSCSDLWDSSSTSDCTVPYYYLNDDWCDCGEACEDELYWTCAACGGDSCGGSCSDDEPCDNSTWSYNIGDDCNFVLLGNLPIVEGECVNFAGTSFIFECDGDMGMISSYASTDDCSGSPTITSNVNTVYIHVVVVQLTVMHIH